MRLPRWLILAILVLNLLAPCAVGAWLWIALPNQTANQFIEALERGDVDLANAMLDDANDADESDVKIYWLKGKDGELELHTSFWDEREDGHWSFPSLAFNASADLEDALMGERTVLIWNAKEEDSRRILVSVKWRRLAERRIYYDYPFNMQ